MSFNGFTSEDFKTFQIDGLSERMSAIQERIQPKFKEIGTHLTEDLSAMVGSEMYLHIAKHARRTVNPPNDTWLAIAGNKRGYKKHPHFQVGLWDDRVFIWLAFIYELPNKSIIASTFLDHFEGLKGHVPGDYIVSLDHTKKDATIFNSVDLTTILEKFRDVKKTELLIGRYIFQNDPILKDGEAFLNIVKQTFATLIPIYKLAYEGIYQTTM